MPLRALDDGHQPDLDCEHTDHSLAGVPATHGIHAHLTTMQSNTFRSADPVARIAAIWTPSRSTTVSQTAPLRPGVRQHFCAYPWAQETSPGPPQPRRDHPTLRRPARRAVRRTGGLNPRAPEHVPTKDR